MLITLDVTELILDQIHLIYATLVDTIQSDSPQKYSGESRPNCH